MPRMKWKTKALGELVTLLPSRSIALAGDAEVSNATSGCLSVFGFRPSGIKRGRMWKRDIAHATLQPGEILVARSNTPDLVGNVARYDGRPGDVVGSDLLMRLWPGESVDGDYLTAHLSARFHGGYWKERAGGASDTMKKITRAQLAALSVSLPPLPEQRRIAARLREQLAEAEKARTALQAQLDAAEKLSSAQLTHLFSDIPKGDGSTRKLAQVFSITARQVDPTLTEFRDLPHVSAENIEPCTGRLLPVKSAAEDGMTSGKYLFDAGDLLYSKLRPYLRKVTIAPFRGVCSADMYPIKVEKALLDPVFAKWLLLSDGFTSYAEEASQRSRMPKLNREQLFGWETLFPSIASQARVGAILDRLAAPTHALVGDIRARLDSLEQLPAALLRKEFGPET